MPPISILTPPFKFVSRDIAQTLPGNVPVPVVMDLKHLSTFTPADGPPEKRARAYAGRFHFGPSIGGSQVSVEIEEVIGERSALAVDQVAQPDWRREEKERGTFEIIFDGRSYRLRAFRDGNKPDELRYYADYALESSIDGHRILIYDLGATGDFSYPHRDFRPEYLVFYRDPRIENDITAIQAQITAGKTLEDAALPVFKELDQEAAVNEAALAKFYDLFATEIRAGKTPADLTDSMLHDINREILKNQPPRRDLLRQCLSANELLHGLRIFVDLNGDGAFDAGESLDADVPFTIGAKTYTLKSVSPDGNAVDFTVEEEKPGEAAKPHPPKIGKIAPAIRGKIVLGEGAGKAISLVPGSPDFKGKVVLVDFWGTWCMPCLGAMPALTKLRTALQKEFGKDHFEVLGIVSRDEKTSVAQINLTLRNWETGQDAYSWPQIHDADTVINTAWAVGSYPSGFLIDGDTGVVLLDQVDPREPETLNNVRALLDEKRHNP